ncbi:hypothetical protein [Roseibium sp. RKSG952]|uniref:hypothetical protein n=1 Tax=Roseibium sp. RKSG952 TaxID=2529384 RepID=UPI0012BCD8B0|nr:hypothetical protein [Roseibium sp. RKSG952]MTH97561.1 hypothetical protein [Roseibium sp. RKSG952]
MKRSRAAEEITPQQLVVRLVKREPAGPDFRVAFFRFFGHTGRDIKMHLTNMQAVSAERMQKGSHPLE